MRKIWILSCVSVAAIFVANAAMANGNLEQLQKNPKDWVMQGGNYAHWNYSTLKQINTQNVKTLRPEWMFSTGEI